MPNKMKKIMDLRGCTTLRASITALGASKPDFVCVDSAWLDSICPVEHYKFFHGIPILVYNE